MLYNNFSPVYAPFRQHLTPVTCVAWIECSKSQFGNRFCRLVRPLYCQLFLPPLAIHSSLWTANLAILSERIMWPKRISVFISAKIGVIGDRSMFNFCSIDLCVLFAVQGIQTATHLKKRGSYSTLVSYILIS